MTEEAIKGYPSKSFFIDMLTLDITVADSILDLMDNSIDSAVLRSGVDVMDLLRGHQIGKPLSDFRIDLCFDDTSLQLTDNCGGVSVKDARERVFLMGSPRMDSKQGGLSVYGIGMKRAFFKLGNDISFESQTEDEYMKLLIDVDAWRGQGNEKWDFDPPETASPRDDRPAGTSIAVTNLREGVAQHLALSTTRSELRARASSTYALFIEAGIEIRVNDQVVESVLPEIGSTGSITPARREFDYDGVDILIMVSVTPQSDHDPRGAYVFCNGRMVLDQDRTWRTGWGDRLPQWHSKFGHLVGFMYFHSDDVRQLPWQTTKQGVVFESAVYQKALDEFQTQAGKVTSFLSRLYKGDVEETGFREREALGQVQSIKITELSTATSAFQVDLPEPEPGEKEVQINFKRKLRDVERVQECFPHLDTRRAVGSFAFDYLFDRECQ